MPKRSVISDLVSSASAAKVHFEVWWAQASEAKPTLVRQMQSHSDFFRASFDAHYMAFHTYVGHLFDTTPKTASIPAYLKEMRARTPTAEYLAIETEYKRLAHRAKPIITARHKTVAHIDAVLTEKEVFSLDPKMTYDEIRDVIYDSAQFVAKLAGHEQQPGAIGIARTRRLIDSTLRLIRALPIDADTD
jgi:hypothetical protein